MLILLPSWCCCCCCCCCFCYDYWQRQEQPAAATATPGYNVFVVISSCDGSQRLRSCGCMLWLLMVSIARCVEHSPRRCRLLPSAVVVAMPRDRGRSSTHTKLISSLCCHHMIEHIDCIITYRRMLLHFVDMVFADVVAILTANATAMSCSCSCCFCLCCCCGCVDVYTFFCGGASMPAAQKPGSQHSSKSAAGSSGGALVLSARLWQPRPSSSPPLHNFKAIV